MTGNKCGYSQVMQVVYSLLLSIFHSKLTVIYDTVASFNHYLSVMTLIGGLCLLFDIYFECANHNSNYFNPTTRQHADSNSITPTRTYNACLLLGMYHLTGQ